MAYWKSIHLEKLETILPTNSISHFVLRIILTYLLILTTYYERCQSELTSTIFFYILLIQHVSRFPYTCLKDAMLSWPPKMFILYLTYFSRFPYLLVFAECYAKLTSKICFLVSHLFSTFQDFLTYLLVFWSMSGWVALQKLFVRFWRES